MFLPVSVSSELFLHRILINKKTLAKIGERLCIVDPASCGLGHGLAVMLISSDHFVESVLMANFVVGEIVDPAAATVHRFDKDGQNLAQRDVDGFDRGRMTENVCPVFFGTKVNFESVMHHVRRILTSSVETNPGPIILIHPKHHARSAVHHVPPTLCSPSYRPARKRIFADIRKEILAVEKSFGKLPKLPSDCKHFLKQLGLLARFCLSLG